MSGYSPHCYFLYLREGRAERGVKSLLARAFLHYLRLFDAATAMRADVMVANSQYVARRIWKTYRREAQVVYPPVDTDAFTLVPEKDDYYLTVSRLVPYKRLDLIVEAFAEMPDKELIVIGEGPELKRLQGLARPNVHLLGYQPFEAVRHYMQRARAFVFAAEEDFGIVPVEAQACGTPVIAYGRGGVTESVVPGKTGLFFPEQSKESLKEAVFSFESDPWDFSPEAIRQHALKFSKERFRESLTRLLSQAWDQFTAS